MMMEKIKYQTIDEYIDTFSKGTRVILEILRNTIRKAAPEVEEKISYQIPTFVLNGNLVHFAAFKNHIGFYPTPSAIEAFKKDLSGYQIAKGSVQFPLNQPLPLPLIAEIVKYRVKENVEKQQESNVKKKN